ncbi:MAG: NINE protein [Thermostichales cyanobacterium BF4_bins_65]
MKNKVVAFVLAWFFGSFGVHKFYLGEIGWGVIYLLFFWTFIPAIVSFIEGIIYLVMSDEKFNRLYNPGSATVQVAVGAASGETSRDRALALQELKRLYDQGVIDALEYEQKRQKLLDQI